MVKERCLVKDQRNLLVQSNYITGVCLGVSLLKDRRMGEFYGMFAPTSTSYEGTRTGIKYYLEI